MRNKKDNWTFQDSIDKDGYYRHNECGSILFRVEPNSNICGIYVYCKKCHKEIKIQNIVNGKITIPKPVLRIKEPA